LEEEEEEKQGQQGDKEAKYLLAHKNINAECMVTKVFGAKL
jgi:hypothetical protein